MKKHAICIIAHSQTALMNALIDKMPADAFDFYIHVDAKSDIKTQITKAANVFVVQKIDVEWGRFSQVQAILTLLEQISPGNCSYVHVISESDFILCSPDEFLAFFAARAGQQFISCTKLETGSSPWSWSGMDRFLVYYPAWLIHRPAKKLFRYTRIFWRELCMRVPALQRKSMPVQEFYGGSSWWSMSAKAVDWMCQYCLTHPDFVTFFEHSLCPDEFFFHTLFMLSDYANAMVKDNLRFMIWNREYGSGGPKVLTTSDLSACDSYGYLFARKFDNLETVYLFEAQFASLRKAL